MWTAPILMFVLDSVCLLETMEIFCDFITFVILMIAVGVWWRV